MIRLGLPEFAMITLVCLAGWVLARAALATALAVPCLQDAAACLHQF